MTKDSILGLIFLILIALGYVLGYASGMITAAYDVKSNCNNFGATKLINEIYECKKRIDK